MGRRFENLVGQLKKNLENNERDMLHAAYKMLERQRTIQKDLGMTDFKKFKEILPSRMKSRFIRKTDFDQFIKGKSIVDFHSFAEMMDDFGLFFDIFCMDLL